jgi:hypothetical protein
VVVDSNGNPAYVVQELRSAGRGDHIVAVDPTTMQITAEVVGRQGVQQSGADPAQPAAEGPEVIVAPGSDYSDPAMAMVSRASQGYYDIAAEVWFELTRGQPYPRDEDGTPLDPGSVFLALTEMPGVNKATSEQLFAMADRYQGMVEQVVRSA